jgi:hypothetical protein
VKPRDPSKTQPPAAPTASGGPAPRRSGRVQFDSRGQAVWEWAVKTGMFDRNASTQRIKALVETPLSLTEDRPPVVEGASKSARSASANASLAVSMRPASGNPYEPAEPRPKLRPGENAGSDPYSSGPAKPRDSR